MQMGTNKHILTAALLDRVPLRQNSFLYMDTYSWRYGLDNKLWRDYVAYKTRARLNVFYLTLCLTDFECGAFLETWMGIRYDSYFGTSVIRSCCFLNWCTCSSFPLYADHLASSKRLRCQPHFRHMCLTHIHQNYAALAI